MINDNMFFNCAQALFFPTRDFVYFEFLTRCKICLKCPQMCLRLLKIICSFVPKAKWIYYRKCFHWLLDIYVRKKTYLWTVCSICMFYKTKRTKIYEKSNSLFWYCWTKNDYGTNTCVEFSDTWLSMVRDDTLHPVSG